MTTSNFFNWSSVRSVGLTMKTKTMKTKTLAYLCIAFACFMFIGNAKAQVTIGSGLAPEGGSILDLKEFAAKSANETSDKGVVLPRVVLTNKYELYPMYWNSNTSSEIADYTNNKADRKLSHAGMTVFNVSNSGDFVSGVHTWTGSEWRKIDDSPVIQPQITNLICGSAQMTPNTYKQWVAGDDDFEAILKVPYLGGNGGSYAGSTAPIVIGNGLSIERIGGKLAYGGGEVMYRVFGRPTVSSPTPTTISSTILDFLGMSCGQNVTIGDGMTGINLKTLVTQTVVNTPYSETTLATVSDELPFGTIIIPESGSYAFSFRLYGQISYSNNTMRFPFYIFLSKNDKSVMSNLLDAAEIDVMVHGTWDYSYSVTLGGAFNAGDEVIISMARPGLGSWTLKTNSNPASPIRTSLIYWKL